MKDTTKEPKDYWYVNGQAYDLKAFSSVHPGGQSQLISVQGRDCTEMVHSMHAIASMDKVKQILEKYKVAIPPKTEESGVFLWNDDGIYSVLKRRVSQYMKSKGETHKADNFFWVVSTLWLAIHTFMFYMWMFRGSILSAFISGFIATSLGFMIFHTAGHNGISKNPKVNTFWFNFFANYILGFINKLWDLHHNYGHHSYTNIHRKDPDVSNALAVIRKTEQQKLKAQHRIQWYTGYLLLVFFPNQWFGQVLQYFMATRRSKMFGVPMIHTWEKSLTPFYIYFGMILALSVWIYAKYGLVFTLISLYLCSFSRGLTYWACVFPNHDTDLSEHSTIDSVKGKVDWGEHQIRSSSNFKAPDVVSYFIGGMNYQIEHHLFPTVHPRHYPAISKMVQEECKAREIPYHLHSSFWDALKGNFRHLYALSKDKSVQESVISAMPTF